MAPIDSSPTSRGALSTERTPSGLTAWFHLGQRPSVVVSSIRTTGSLVQVPGRGLTMSVADFREHIAEVDGALTAVLRRSAQAMFTQVARNAACNRVHTVRQRAARC